MRRLLFNNANQINTIIIGFNDGDMQWPYINHIAHTGNVTICRDHEARDRRDIIVIGKVLNIKRLLQGMQICTAFYQPAVTIGNDFRRFVSVREFTRNGFQHIQRRDQTYLYVEKKDDFSRVPEELMKGFGQPQLAMILPLDGRKKLVNADIEKVKQALTEQGYYLQLPPPPEDLLKQHLSVMGQKTDDTNK